MMREAKRKALSPKNGSTLVSVIAAFAMLLVCCGMFFNAMVLAAKLTEKSETMRLRYEAGLNNYYEARVLGATEDEITLNGGTAGSFELRTKLDSVTDGEGVCFFYFK